MAKPTLEQLVMARVEAAWAVGGPSSGAQEVLPALAAALNDEDPIVRADAAWMLGHLGPVAVSAVPALTAALKDDDADVRSKAASALEAIQAT